MTLPDAAAALPLPELALLPADEEELLEEEPAEEAEPVEAAAPAAVLPDADAEPVLLDAATPAAACLSSSAVVAALSRF